MNLRSYQEDLINRTRASMQKGHRSPLLVAPCGSGKTVMFSYFAKTVTSKNKRTLILAHREELIEQISSTLRIFDVRHSFIAAGHPYSRVPQVQVGSVFSVVRRLSRIDIPDIIIIDEAHHARASTYEKIFNAFPKAWRIGVTASPIRLSGESLGDIFDDLIIGPTIKELTAMGFLCPYKLFVPSTMNTDSVHSRMGDFVRSELVNIVDRPTITGDAIKEYRKNADHKRAIVFGISIPHIQHVAEQFNDAGYRAMAIDGKMPGDTRRRIVDKFREGHLDILASCDLVSEGFDLPAIECAIMLRPTESKALWIQQTGRALRIQEGKKYAVLLDHAGNTLRHDMPDADHEWSLEGREKSKGEYQAPIRICASCFGANRSGTISCAYCGSIFPLKPREIHQVAGELKEVDPAQLALKLKWRRAQGMAQGFKELVEIGKARRFKKPEAWASIILKSRAAKKLKEAV